MSSKRYNKLPKKTNELKPEVIDKLLVEIKKNCTTKFDESIDLSFQINNKQKKGEINLRTVVNLPGGTGKKIKVAVVCEEAKAKIAKDSGADLVGGDDLIEKIKEGMLNFDKLISTPSMMLKLSKLGIIFLIIGLIYILIASRWLLHSRSIISSLSRKYHLGPYFTEFKVGPDSQLVGSLIKTFKDGTQVLRVNNKPEVDKSLTCLLHCRLLTSH